MHVCVCSCMFQADWLHGYSRYNGWHVLLRGLRGQVYVGLSCHQPAAGLSGQMEFLRGCTDLCMCAYVFRFEFATEGWRHWTSLIPKILV